MLVLRRYRIEACSRARSQYLRRLYSPGLWSARNKAVLDRDRVDRSRSREWARAIRPARPLEAERPLGLSVDFETIERGNYGHAKTQNALADFLRTR